MIDLKTPQKLVARSKLVTSTPGMTVQVYGANGADRAGLDHRPGVGPAEPLAGAREEAPRAHQAARLDEGVPLRHAVDQQRARRVGRHRRRRPAT